MQWRFSIIGWRAPGLPPPNVYAYANYDGIIALKQSANRSIVLAKILS